MTYKDTIKKKLNNGSRYDILINTYPKDFVAQFAVLMPVHNEEGSITAVVNNVYEKLCKISKFPFEIVLAEDGSKDKTKDVIMQLSNKIPLKAILSDKRKGYAVAIKDGLKFVSAHFVLICDSDGQHDPEDFWKLRCKLAEQDFRKDTIISGYRITRNDALHRRIISKTFQKINSIMFDLIPLKDITSPFKLMSTQLAINISSECQFMNESFWTEFVVRACNKNLTIIEVPVQHANRYAGRTVVYKKSKIPRIVINQLVALVKLKKDLTQKSIIYSLLEIKAIRRLVSFFLVGVSGAALILLLMWIGTTLLHVHYMITAVIAIELSIIWAFMFNDKFTFRDKTGNAKSSIKLCRLLKYHVSALTGETINISILFILTNAGFYYLHSEAVALLVAFGYNFTLSSRWVWRRRLD